MSVTVYCIVGSFTGHLLLSLYSYAMYRALLQFLYELFFFLLLFCFLDVVGEAFYIGIVYHLYFLDVFKNIYIILFCFFCFVFFGDF